MKRIKEEGVLAYPDRDEIKAAQLACCGRHCSLCEVPAEYAWRKREVDMALLLERAIKKELTATEQTAIRLYWYDGESITEISRKKGISPAAVKSTLDRAQEKLERVLGYIVLYQQNLMNETVIPLAVARARAIACARNYTGGNAGKRIMNLRLGQFLSTDAISLATGISPSRLMKIEKGEEPDNAELILLSEIFDVTTDYILKGEKDVTNENIA